MRISRPWRPAEACHLFVLGFSHLLVASAAPAARRTAHVTDPDGRGAPPLRARAATNFGTAAPDIRIVGDGAP